MQHRLNLVEYAIKGMAWGNGSHGVEREKNMDAPQVSTRCSKMKSASIEDRFMISTISQVPASRT